MKENDTIVAISTPFGSGGIGIIRISGEKAFYMAEQIFEGKKKFQQIKSHTINYGKIIDPDSKQVIDHVLLTKMEGPNTYTKEDTVEINCHGGLIVLQEVLELLLKIGGRLAEPGEFTKRAFLKGRIDLAQSEAVMDLIMAKSSRSSRIALEQLEGRLSSKIVEIRKKLVALIAHIEATIEYPEEGLDEIREEEIIASLEEVEKQLNKLLSAFNKGRVFKEGIRVIIVGRPNAGKSSLLNRLAGFDRAIVTDIPGTTRDILEENITIAGIPIRIIDTAGIREPQNQVEIIGVKLAKAAIKTADLVIVVVDASLGIVEEDIKLLKQIKKEEDKPLIILYNKIDLLEVRETRETIETGPLSEEKTDREEMAIKHTAMLEGIKAIETSMKDGRGIEKLEKEIENLFLGGKIDLDEEILVTNLRHGSLLKEALKSVKNGISAYRNSMPLDCVTIDIREGAQYLGKITGETIEEEVLTEIFTTFCVGK